jgi:hypothetical protein
MENVTRTVRLLWVCAHQNGELTKEWAAISR